MQDDDDADAPAEVPFHGVSAGCHTGIAVTELDGECWGHGNYFSSSLYSTYPLVIGFMGNPWTSLDFLGFDGISEGFHGILR